MQSSPLRRAGMLTFVLVTGAVISWECYLRNQGHAISYDEGKELWADKRARVYQPPDQSTVFIGSSRIKYDLDFPTWEKLTGENPVQLAMEGSSPMAMLDDLADDQKFKGKLVVDITEGLFFSKSDFANGGPHENVNYYHKETPAQKASFYINTFLESKLVFLDKESFSLNALIKKEFPVADRPGVFNFPIFPRDFELVNFTRQDHMSDRFVSDTNLQNQVKGIWGFFAKTLAEPPLSGAALDSFFMHVKEDVNKIKSRGGQVLFVRTPSSGPYFQGESMGFPREKYWNRLLTETGCAGVHFLDYPLTAGMQCPEFSHLKPADAVIYTTNLAAVLQKEKGWVFPHKP